MVAKLSLSGSLSGAKCASPTTQSNVVSYLREAILAGELLPGTRLVQSELAAALKVSVTPVREALPPPPPPPPPTPQPPPPLGS